MTGYTPHGPLGVGSAPLGNLGTVVPAGEPWIHELSKGQVLRIVDLHGNQAFFETLSATFSSSCFGLF